MVLRTTVLIFGAGDDADDSVGARARAMKGKGILKVVGARALAIMPRNLKVALGRRQ